MSHQISPKKILLLIAEVDSLIQEVTKKPSQSSLAEVIVERLDTSLELSDGVVLVRPKNEQVH